MSRPSPPGRSCQDRLVPKRWRGPGPPRSATARSPGSSHLLVGHLGGCHWTKPIGMDELPEEVIEDAEEANVAHTHDAVWADDDSLLDHLRSQHQLPADSGLSTSTQQGLHDRLHDETDAVED
jgi:hypothetical protein